MSTATTVSRPPLPALGAGRPVRAPRLSAAFAPTLAVHLTRVTPVLHAELAYWTRRARAIPSPELGRAAAEALCKRGNLEGAALFATLAPPQHRTVATRALVRFQTAYNYLDALSEQPSPSPRVNAARLHQALAAALHAPMRDPDFYAVYPHDRNDAGFLADLVDGCADACAQLPSFPAVTEMARAAAQRIVCFQALNLPQQAGGHAALQRWAAAAAVGEDLCWWEQAAASGSSLAVHALLAAAASPGLGHDDARTAHDVYHPWGGALHSLLDSLVDRHEDDAKRQRSLLEGYATPADTACRIKTLALRARDAAHSAPQSARHTVILTAMCAYYLSAPECRGPEADAVRAALLEVFGASLRVALALFAAKRFAHTLTPGSFS